MSTDCSNRCRRTHSRITGCSWSASLVLLALEAMLAGSWHAAMPVRAAAARLARGVCDSQPRADRQHDAADDPPPDRRRLGYRCGTSAAAGGRNDRRWPRSRSSRCCSGFRTSIPWAGDSAAIPPDVARWYLNGPSFLIRGAARTRRLVHARHSSLPPALGSRLLAGLGLAFFGLSISLVAVDWYLSLEPHYVATAFAAMIAIQHLLAALAFTALIAAPQLDGKVAGDIGALMIATLLGVVYLEFMTFVVAWYGDLPDEGGLVSEALPARAGSPS